jgi:hypothetical protein
MPTVSISNDAYILLKTSEMQLSCLMPKKWGGDELVALILSRS